MKFFSSKEKTKVRHHAAAFISRAEEIAVIATLHFNGKGGFLYEDDFPIVLSAPLDPIALGQTLLTAIKGTTISQLNLLNRPKLKDWPAFKASKAASVRQFEQNFIRIHVSSANDMNLIYIMEGAPYKDAELCVTSSISSAAPPAEIGKRILSVFYACRDRKL